MSNQFSVGVKIIYGIFVLACITMGAIWAQYVTDTGGNDTPVSWLIVGGAVGAGVAIAVLFCLRFITQEVYERISPALVAIVIAMVVGWVLAQYILLWFPEASREVRVFMNVSLVLVFGFIGISIGLTRASNWEMLISAVQRHNRNQGSLKLVDTSVIIDGRIADICQSGFLEGTLIVPRFVLHELQHIADSSEVLRRAKGRRGLDILKQMQDGLGNISVEIIEDDPQEVREVDAKLVKLARKFNAKILTNDFNLNKVAQIEGIIVLNINDLANALKPAVLPDEQMEVKLIKEGKEPGQGVGYLDDGTMVVVDGGRNFVGQVVGVTVTSVLQTAAGRMIFGKMPGL
jgi:uncharacterized protein YacL